MPPISYARHQFPPAVIQHAVWLYARFTLSFRDVEDLLAERGLDISYETVRRWVRKFGPAIARRLWRLRLTASPRSHVVDMAILLREYARYATLGGWDGTAFPSHDGARRRAVHLSANPER